MRAAINNYLANVYAPALAAPVFTNQQLRNEMALLDKLMAGDLSGIHQLTTTEDQPVIYYTIDGKPVAQPGPHGIYLMRDAKGRTRKVVR